MEYEKDLSDLEVVTALSSDNPSDKNSALRFLIKRHYGLMRHVIDSLNQELITKAEYEEIIQEALMKVLKNITQYEDRGNKFMTWVTTIVKNCAMDRVKRNKKERFGGTKKEDASLTEKEQCSYPKTKRAFSRSTYFFKKHNINELETTIERLNCIDRKLKEIYEKSPKHYFFMQMVVEGYTIDELINYRYSTDKDISHEKKYQATKQFMYDCRKRLSVQLEDCNQI